MELTPDTTPAFATTGISDEQMRQIDLDLLDVERNDDDLVEAELIALAARETATKPKPQVRVVVHGKRFKVEVRRTGEVRWTRHGTYTTEAPAHLAAIALLAEVGAA
jgi:hypothetical protein